MKMRFPFVGLKIGATSLAVASAIVSLLAGCGHRADVRHNEPTTDIEYDDFIPPGSKRYALSPGEDFEAPRLIWSTLPEYPASLIGTRTARIAIKAKLVVNERGGVDRAMFDEVPGSESEELYRQAIRVAVASWKFTPLQIIRAAKGGGGEAVPEKTAKPCSLWYEFRFMVKDGRPTSDMSEQSVR